MIRRHLKDCPQTSSKYRRCKCPIHVYGTLAGERIRKALDQTSWDAASELITAWTAAGESGVVKAEAPTIREAVGKYLTDCEARHLGWEAMRKYRHLLEDRFIPWAERKGFHNLKQVSVDVLRQFRQSWADGPLYATKNLERTRAFFRFCHQAGWIKENPAKAVKPPELSPRTFWNFAGEFSSFRRQGAAMKSGADLGHGSARLLGPAIRFSRAVA